jgi:hypothetical protein
MLPLLIMYRLYEFVGQSLGGVLAVEKHVSRDVFFGAPVPHFCTCV